MAIGSVLVVSRKLWRSLENNEHGMYNVALCTVIVDKIKFLRQSYISCQQNWSNELLEWNWPYMLCVVWCGSIKSVDKQGNQKYPQKYVESCSFVHLPWLRYGRRHKTIIFNVIGSWDVRMHKHQIVTGGKMHHRSRKRAPQTKQENIKNCKWK